MKRSTDRILTTHVGSLIRPPELLDQLRARQGGKGDQRAYEDCLKASVAAVVKRQADAGIDVVSDGEFGKNISWSQYALERLSGFERRKVALNANPFVAGADRARFKEFYAEMDAQQAPSSDWESICVGPITHTGLAALEPHIADVEAGIKHVHDVEA